MSKAGRVMHVSIGSNYNFSSLKELHGDQSAHVSTEEHLVFTVGRMVDGDTSFRLV